jgi:nucleolar protein 12
MQGNRAGLTAKGTKRKAEDEMEENESGEEEELSSDDEDEEALDIGSGDINDLILGSLAGPKGSTKGKKEANSGKADKKKSEKALKRSQETPEERDLRTVFLGNVPADCSTNKVRLLFSSPPFPPFIAHFSLSSSFKQSLKKALVRHVLQNPALSDSLPSSCPLSLLKLDSIRFRSLAFASKVFGRKAHAAPGVVDVEEGSGLAGSGGRGRKRAREWREADGSDERGVKGGFHAKEKPKPVEEVRAGPLSDAQKRRVAFIRGELNEGKKACNAYLVLEALPENVDVREVIQAIVAAANNSLFEGVTIHADLVRPRSAAAILAAAQMAAKPNPNLTEVPRNAETHHVSAHEAKRTLFIGGLDFAESEESVRSATEAVLVRERGDAGGRPYVQNVRIIRDAGTGLGKGFCYVEFSVRFSSFFPFLPVSNLRSTHRTSNASTNSSPSLPARTSRSRSARSVSNAAKRPPLPPVAKPAEPPPRPPVFNPPARTVPPLPPPAPLVPPLLATRNKDVSPLPFPPLRKSHTKLNSPKLSPRCRRTNVRRLSRWMRNDWLVVRRRRSRRG